MIKANELRIGNVILFEDGGLLSLVKGIDADGLGLSIYIPKTEEETWIELQYFSPIPLTPEILEKCDIKHFPSELFWNGNDYHISFENGEWLFIKYLHQLQNLYFALTGEELNIEL